MSGTGTSLGIVNFTTNRAFRNLVSTQVHLQIICKTGVTIPDADCCDILDRGYWVTVWDSPEVETIIEIGYGKDVLEAYRQLPNIQQREIAMYMVMDRNSGVGITDDIVFQGYVYDLIQKEYQCPPEQNIKRITTGNTVDIIFNRMGLSLQRETISLLQSLEITVPEMTKIMADKVPTVTVIDSEMTQV